jgi:hypothetical protein
VSVTTDANVPITTATDADSIRASFCRAITNTFNAEADEDRAEIRYREIENVGHERASFFLVDGSFRESRPIDESKG